MIDARLFLPVTEAAAVAASALVGSGDKDGVDGAAVAAMRRAFASLPVDARIVVGEGEKDEAPMLFVGEELGAGGTEADVAVDPVDGTRLAAAGEPGSVAVLAAAPRGALFDVGSVYYMEKLITVGAGAELSLDRPLSENLRLLADALGRPVSELRVAVQTRPRNRRYLDEAAAAGAVRLPFADGDVVESVRAARGDGVDLLVGIGGAPEGVLTAVAVRAAGGHMQGRLAPQTDGERERARANGQDWGGVIPLDTLVAAPGVVALTAVTDGDLLDERGLAGVRRDGGEIVTETLLIEHGRMPERVVTRHPLPSA